MSVIVRRVAGTPLSEEAREQLRALADMPDSDIDFTDIPQRPQSTMPEPLPLEEHTLTLRVDSEVAAWLEDSSVNAAGLVNAVLKREVQRTRRNQAVERELDIAS